MSALLAVTIISALASTAVSVKQGRDVQKAQEEQNEIVSAQERINDVRASRRRSKEARVARARLLQQSEAAGTTGSSGESGGLSSIQSQLGANQAQQTGAANTADALTGVSERLSRKTFFNQTVAGVARASSSIFSANT